MKKTLRPYQQDAVTLIKQSLHEFKDPILVSASVGAGKSLIIAETLKWIEQGNSSYNVLCLTLSSILVQQNSDTYKAQGGNCGIFCASLERREISQIMFATPHSVWSDLKGNGELSKVKINLIVIDEAHNISPFDEKTMFRRILNHYGHLAQSYGHSYRIIGLTGTPYRGKGDSIIGETQFFKKEICNISTSWLIEQGFLTKPTFGLPKIHSYDFSRLKTNSLGKFNTAELEDVILKNERLTGKIMRELTQIMQNRSGAFIFASTKRHCYECAKSLPDGEWAIILGDTPHDERKTILDDAKNGTIRYLISVNCLNVGVDVPPFDICAWLRPTESLILYTQGIGRVLRISPGKTEAIVLDYAGNLERHGDIDNPIINEALQPKEENAKEYVIPCNCCNVLNTIYSRRCIGVSDQGRCQNFFVWKDCPRCAAKNDSTSRVCRECSAELIDPNKKLTRNNNLNNTESFVVKEGRYWVSGTHAMPCFSASYLTVNGLTIHESFVIRETRTANIFYAQFMKRHIDAPYRFYKGLRYLSTLKKIIQNEPIKTPNEIHCVWEKNKYRIKKKIFNEENNAIIDAHANRMHSG